MKRNEFTDQKCSVETVSLDRLFTGGKIVYGWVGLISKLFLFGNVQPEN